jgi:hypothetical protein
MKINVQVHNGPIVCMRYLNACFEGKPTLISGGSDQLICLVDPITI